MAKRILCDIKDHLFKKKKKGGEISQLIRNSLISNLDLISPMANIENSQLSGRVIVGDFSKIIDVHIVGSVSIGRWSTINGPNSDIFTRINSVRIGNFVSIARNVSIQEYDHIFSRATSYFLLSNFFGETMKDDIVSKGDIIIGNDVWIGTQSVILSGSVISDGAVIGANSVVNSLIPPFAVAVGSPAKVIKYRFPEEIIQRLLEIKWWDWTDEQIRKNRQLFEGVLISEKMDLIVK